MLLLLGTAGTTGTAGMAGNTKNLTFKFYIPPKPTLEYLHRVLKL